MLAAAVIVCGTLLGFNAPARANDVGGGGDSIAAPRSYVQLVSTAPAGTAAADGTQAPATIARGEIGGAQGLTAKTAERVKLAEADNLFDAVKGWMENQDSAAPSD